MGRPKSWIPRIPHILQYLEADLAPHYKRGEVEKLFNVSPTQAKELMWVAGAGRGVDQLIVSRSNLIAYVKHSPEAQEAFRELERRKRLATTLRAADDDAKLRTVPLPCSSADEWSKLRDLPNVSIQPGRLVVTFTDPYDLFGTLYRLGKAAGNDWELFQKMCEQAALPLESSDARVEVQ